jgi:acetoin utilization deacetylase AcuC-like enzyme
MRLVGRELGVPVGVVLEGGYALDPLARSVAVTLEALSTPDGDADGVAVEVSPPVSAARERLAEWWPALA